MPRSSAHALLRTLVAQGWVRSDASGTLYGIGIRALLVGTSYLDNDPYLPLITPFLDDLRQDLDETFHLGRLDGTDIVYLATRDQAVRSRIGPGRQAAARLPALGKALLADGSAPTVTSTFRPAKAAHPQRSPDRPALDDVLDGWVRGIRHR
jgi:DNA-binding IclR family transcriptional regulator